MTENQDTKAKYDLEERIVWIFVFVFWDLFDACILFFG